MRDEGRGKRTRRRRTRAKAFGMRSVLARRRRKAPRFGGGSRRRLGRMPVELLETFALSRLGNLTVKDIARGTGASEANVKVRVHRARQMLGKVMSSELRVDNRQFGWAVFRVVMMLAAVDGEIDKEELSLYRGVPADRRDRHRRADDADPVESG